MEWEVKPVNVYHLTAPNSPLSPKICRDTVALLLAANGHGPCLADTARILVSEVVTNAVLHTGTPTISMKTAVTAEGVRVAVYDDGGPVVPGGPLVPAEVAQDSEGGRGLFLLEALAHRWGSTPRRPRALHGKHVWFELRTRV